VTITYETMGLVAWEGASPLERSWKPAAELREVLAGYAGSPAWLRVDGRPVLCVYVANRDPELWPHLRAQLEADGHRPFLVGDGGEEWFDDVDAGTPGWMAAFDAVYSYVPVRHLDEGGDVAAAYRRFAAQARAERRLFAGTAIPGYDDRAVRARSRVVPRADGGVLRSTWRAAVEAPADWIVITSYNEWHEGTQIEPSQEHGRDYLEAVAGLARSFRAGGPTGQLDGSTLGRPR
jgi:hypothetical protein